MPTPHWEFLRFVSNTQGENDMKRKKLFLNLILAALGTVSFLGACEKKDDTSESIVEPAVYEDGEYTLLDFENQSDLYKTRIYTEQILDIYGKVEI